MSRPYKRPESVLVVVYTRAGEVLLLRRVGPSGFWQSVTGSLRWDEDDPRAAARRELHEETGIETDAVIDCGEAHHYPILPEWRHRYAPGVTENHERVFRLELAERVPVRLNPGEHDDYCWLPRQAAAARVWSWTNRAAILRWVPTV